VVQHQLVKRGEAWTNPTTADEQYLASKLAAVLRSSTEVLSKVKGIPAEEAVIHLQALVEGWQSIDNNSIISKIQYHQQKQATASAHRMLHQLEVASVKNKRKLEA